MNYEWSSWAANYFSIFSAMKNHQYSDGPKSYNDKQPGTFTSVRPLIKEALLNNMWLYNTYSNTWYTPEEFVEKFSDNKYSNYDIAQILEHVVVRDPRAGIRAFYKQLEKTIIDLQEVTKSLRDKGEAFQLRVSDYYYNKSAAKKNDTNNGKSNL